MLLSWAQGSFLLTQRRAFSALGVKRSIVRYMSRRPVQAPLRQRLHELAAVRTSYGYRVLHVILRREGRGVNHKRVYRLYRDEGMNLRRKRPGRWRSAMPRQARPPQAPNHVWSIDFMSDALADEGKLRVLTVLDTDTPECVAVEFQRHCTGEDVSRVLEQAGSQLRILEQITVDSGPELTSVVLDRWARLQGVNLHFSRPGKPGDNASIESSNARIRQECLSQHDFTTLEEATPHSEDVAEQLQQLSA